MMKDDLIKREYAIAALEALIEDPEEDEHDETWNAAISGAIVSIKYHVPSTRLRGIKWKVKYDHRQTECSECSFYDPVVYECPICHHYQHNSSNYCSNCGTKMINEVQS